MPRNHLRVGLIADTHGLLRPEVLAAFAHVDQIVHAGDIGGAAVIAELEQIAPVAAVSGNNDDASGYEIKRLTVGAVRILLTHILPRPHAPAEKVMKSLGNQPADLVVFGHSHLPHDEQVNGIRFFNPASAGPRRFDLPVAVGLLEIDGALLRLAHIALDERSVAALKKRMNQLSRRR